ADGAALPDLAVDEVGMDDGGAGGDGGVDEGGMRADDGAGGDPGSAAQRAAGLDPDIGGELDVGVDPRRVGVDDRHPGEHVAAVHERPGPTLGGGEGGEGVDRKVDGGVVLEVGADG